MHAREFDLRYGRLPLDMPASPAALSTKLDQIYRMGSSVYRFVCIARTGGELRKAAGLRDGARISEARQRKASVTAARSET